MKGFSLEKSIQRWCRTLAKSQLEEGTKQELENHLRDSIEDYIAEGMTQQEAFELAVKRTGRPIELGKEDFKSRRGSRSSIEAMISQTFLIQWRLIKRRSVFSLINVFGLALGFACCLLIALFVKDELSYDKFHTKSDRILRVATNATVNGTERAWSLVPSNFVAAVYDELPEVIDFTMIFPSNASQRTVKYNNQLFDESEGNYGQVWMADTSFFSVFDFEFLAGNPDVAIAPNSVVITESKAMKLFNRTDAVGEIIEITNIGKVAVTGIIKDPPRNSHLQFGYLVHSDFTVSGFVPFLWVRAYLVMNDQGSQAKIQQSLKAIVDKTKSQSMNSVEMDPFVQPLGDVHLTSHLEYEIGSSGNKKNVTTFSLIAVVILLIAGINFTNLATAKSTIRAREVGVRKVLGARKKQLVSQFLSESVTMSLVALAFGFGFVLLALPIFNSLTGKTFSLSEVLQMKIVVSAILLSLIVGITAGIYPAFFMSNFKPLIVLKGVLSLGKNRGTLRKLLVVLQFAISVVMIFATLIVLKQINFMKNKGLGFEKDHVIVLPIDRSWTREIPLLKKELDKINGVLSTSASSHIPSTRGGVMLMRPEGFNDNEAQMLDGFFTDFDFIRTYGLQISYGRDFDENMVTDSTNFVVNETALKKFGWSVDEQSIGKKISFPSGNGPNAGMEGIVVGIVRDAHFRSLHHEISPLLITIANSRFSFQGSNYLSVRVQGDNLPGLLDRIESKWEELSLNKAFTYSFLDQQFDEQYKSDEKLSELFIYFSFIAILIACMGLFALAAFSTEQKRKEIGIRKTLGATVTQLSSKITWSFTQWVLIANLIAWPIAGFVMNQWLQGFAYRTNMSPLTFILSTLASLFIAWLTVSYMSVKAAKTNPVMALRHE